MRLLIHPGYGEGGEGPAVRSWVKIPRLRAGYFY